MGLPLRQRQAQTGLFIQITPNRASISKAKILQDIAKPYKKSGIKRVADTETGVNISCCKYASKRYNRSKIYINHKN